MKQKLLFTLWIFISACGNMKNTEQQTYADWNAGLQNPDQPFYSLLGEEREIEFQASFLSSYKSIDQLKKLSEAQKQRIITTEIKPTIEYLFGPLTHRSIGGKQRQQKVFVNWNSAYQESNRVFIPYQVQGVWIIDKVSAENQVLILPLPYNEKIILTPSWKSCTDQDPEHQTVSFYWYFWDPTRLGCDQILGIHYQNIKLIVGRPTEKTIQSFPEYEKMFRKNSDGKKTLQMTYAFGYVEDPALAKPFEDYDYGVIEFRKFHDQARSLIRSKFPQAKIQESLITESEYLQGQNPTNAIGTRLSWEFEGIVYVVNIVASANIDQMDLFAKSFAHDHEPLFAWFGHSRVGSGFDAQKFVNIMSASPEYYKLTNDYQVIYWAGCNSYSYYTLPFFDIKGGTKGLDIVSNGLPSLFAFNADNAAITLEKMLNWKNRPTYQSWVDDLENRARLWGTLVLVNVLGDEDNAN